MAAYPHKQTVLILILCVIAVGGFAYYVFGREDASAAAAKEQSSVLAESAPSEPLPETDWQKQFISKTASSTAFKAATDVKKDEKPEKQTPTYELGQNFLTQYIELRQKGLSSDEDLVKAAMDDVVVKSSGAIPPPKTYAARDVSIVNDSASAFQQYNKSLNQAAELYAAHRDEAEIAADALENSDFTKLSEVDASISEYKNILASLVGSQVPRSFADRHLDLLNSLSQLLYSAQAFRHIDTDPLTGLATIRLNAVATLETERLFLDISAKLKAPVTTL